ncbi:MAG: pyridoxamine 5'-phosphate oxidase [Phycisphaerales bacterium]|nr:pyridoxamine 5'-phosphate oxidase [Phycisphaerales bacterium]
MLKLAAAESLPDSLPADPLLLLTQWYEQAKAAKSTPNPDAVALATATPDGHPSVRMVLCRHVEPDGSLMFYTNYDSRKSADLLANPRAAVVFHWDHQGRQARAEGFTVHATDQESDAYFNKRALLSRLGSWASKQSSPLASRKDLVTAVAQAATRLRVSIESLLSPKPAITIPRPPNWGGFRIWIDRLELWCGGSGRLHDRAAWIRQRTDGQSTLAPGQLPSFTPWQAQRLYP